MENVNERILHACLEEYTIFEKLNHEALTNLAMPYENDCSFFYSVYESLKECESDEVEMSDEWCTYKKFNAAYSLETEGFSVVFSYDEIVKYLQLAISVLEPVLPLGSVVDLKKEFLASFLPIEKIENVRILITHRFLCRGEDPYYFPYAGTVYPFGTAGERYIHFTPNLIHNIVFKGFSDPQEEAFVYVMKEALLRERKLLPMSFADKEAVEAYQVN